jgi:hypothetical protein
MSSESSDVGSIPTASTNTYVWSNFYFCDLNHSFAVMAILCFQLEIKNNGKDQLLFKLVFFLSDRRVYIALKY